MIPDDAEGNIASAWFARWRFARCPSIASCSGAGTVIWFVWPAGIATTSELLNFESRLPSAIEEESFPLCSVPAVAVDCRTRSNSSAISPTSCSILMNAWDVCGPVNAGIPPNGSKRMIRSRETCFCRSRILSAVTKGSSSGSWGDAKPASSLVRARTALFAGT